MKPQIPLTRFFKDIKQRTNSYAFKIKIESEWTTISWPQYYEDILRTATGLTTLGITHGDRVCIFCNTRYEWCVLDIACQLLGIITVPIYPNSSSDDVKYIINHAECKSVILEGKAQLKILEKVKSDCPTLSSIFIIDESPLDYIKKFKKDLQVICDKNSENIILESASRIQSNTDVTIVYTSGTTGNPKGVLLTQEQIVSEVSEAFSCCQISTKDVSLTFLPFSHVFGRIEVWAHFYFGYHMAIAESIDKIKNNLQEIQPSFLFAVPRIFEKIFMFIKSSLENDPIKSKVFHWAYAQSEDKFKKLEGELAIDLKTYVLAEVANRTILKNVKKAFGENLRFCVSGGAALNFEVAEFFRNCGVQILEGYGLTETTAAICVNRPYNQVIGTVGKPIGDVQLKIAEDGEVLVKSSKVMKEYFNDPKSTEKVFQDGWFKTGDIGELTFSGELKITDRKKDLIKTANGKYVAPQKVEGLLKLSPLIGHALIHGDQKKYIVAIITLERSYVYQLLKSNETHLSWSDAIQNHSVQEEIRKHIIKINSDLANHETIKKYKIIEDEFTVVNGSLTQSLKVKRKLLDQKYKDIIESLY